MSGNAYHDALPCFWCDKRPGIRLRQVGERAYPICVECNSCADCGDTGIVHYDDAHGMPRNAPCPCATRYA